jgi:hypothetical protein
MSVIQHTLLPPHHKILAMRNSCDITVSVPASSRHHELISSGAINIVSDKFYLQHAVNITQFSDCILEQFAQF